MGADITQSQTYIEDFQQRADLSLHPWEAKFPVISYWIVFHNLSAKMCTSVAPAFHEEAKHLVLLLLLLFSKQKSPNPALSHLHDIINTYLRLSIPLSLSQDAEKPWNNVLLDISIFYFGSKN